MVDIQAPLDQEGSSRPQLHSWQALVAHKTTISKLTLPNLFKENSRRFEDYSIAIDGLLFDYSKNLLTNRTIDLLKKLASDCDLPAAIENLFAGKHVNTTEDRPALHTALRNPADSTLVVDGKDLMPEIGQELAKMRELVEKLHRGEYLGSTGKPITDVVNIGVGGSDLGAVMASEALSEYKQGPV